ncbi:MAG: restriction endonuclease subunit S [Pseudanabaenaceae cyanobacterium bins.39]|nr:restriction endonuclease subunit S [Pseudanabaenaceae cyanobacterium bins.39]
MSDMNFLERLLDGVAVEWKPLGEEFPFIRNGFVGTVTPFFTDAENGVRYLQGTNIHNGVISDNAAYYVTKDFHQKCSRTQLKADDILMVQSGHIGESAVVGEKYEGSNCHALIVMSNGGKCNSKFVNYYFQSTDGKNKLKRITTGGTVKHILASKMKQFIIPIPPLKIQAEIVRILDTFTELTAELTAELIARQKQYEYYRDRLLTFEEGKVEWKTLGEITRIFSASRVHKNEWTTAGVPFFRTSDVISIFNGVKNSRDDAFISNELYETLSSKSGKVQKNDILVTGGGTIGIPYIVPTDEPLYFKDADLLCIKKSKILNSKFLYHYFLTTKFRIYLDNISHNSTIAHYTISQITKTPVPIPPLEEQARIVAILDKFDTLTTSIREGLPREIALRQQQYEYYRDLLLSFPKAEEDGK